jgi:hypothetical protein
MMIVDYQSIVAAKSTEYLEYTVCVQGNPCCRDDHSERERLILMTYERVPQEYSSNTENLQLYIFRICVFPRCSAKTKIPLQVVNGAAVCGRASSSQQFIIITIRFGLMILFEAIPISPILF